MVTFLAIVACCFAIVAGFNWFCVAVKADEDNPGGWIKRCPNCQHPLDSNTATCFACGYKHKPDND